MGQSSAADLRGRSGVRQCWRRLERRLGRKLAHAPRQVNPLSLHAGAGREPTARQLPRFRPLNPLRGTAALKPPQSRRFAPHGNLAGARQRLDCGGFSTAVEPAQAPSPLRGSWVATTDQSPRIGAMNRRRSPADSRRPQMENPICGRLESAGGSWRGMGRGEP